MHSGAWQGMKGQVSFSSAYLYGNQAATQSEQVQELRNPCCTGNKVSTI